MIGREALRGKVREFARRDAWAAGRRFFEAEAAADPRGAAARAGLGFFCLKESRYDARRAVSELAEALRLDPDLALAHVYLAIALACLEDGPGARAAAAAARRRGVVEADAVMAEAYVELDTGELSRAVVLFRRLAELEPESTSLLLLSQALAQAGDHAGALSRAREAARLDPADFRAPAYEGVYLSYLGRLDEARGALERSLAMDSGYALAHHALARVARGQGRADEAERRLRDALAADPDYVCSRKDLAELCARSGRRDEARAHYRAALKLFPEWTELRSALASLG